MANGQWGLTDGSRNGDWKLLNIREFHSLFDYAYDNPALGNTLGNAKWEEGHPFTDLITDSLYWSSTTYATNSDQAFYMIMYICFATPYPKGWLLLRLACARWTVIDHLVI